MLRKARETKLRLIQESNKRLLKEGTIMYELQDEFEEGKNEMTGKYKAIKNGENVSLYLDGRLIDLTTTVGRFK